MERDIVKISMTMEECASNHHFSAEVSTPLYRDLGSDELGTLASFINNFLKSYGFPRYDKDYVFLESVTEDEYDYLLSCLEDYRSNEK